MKPKMIDGEFTAQPDLLAPPPLSRRVDLSAIWALFELSAGRMLRGRRLLILSLLFALPTLFAVLAQKYEPRFDTRTAEIAFIFGMIPQALVPLAALVYASGMVQDEIEEQTLTYLLIRPIPRGLIYLTKLAATILITSTIAAVFTTLCLVVTYQGDWEADSLQPSHVLGVIGLLTLSIAAYCSLFGLLSLVLKRTLILGLIYIILFEGVLANIDFIVRKLTIMYYFRVISVRWLEQKSADWNIDLKLAPTAWECLWTLTIATLVFSFAAAWIFDRREFRLKTPEGS